MKSDLHPVELFIYFFVWISANIYSLYKLFDAQSEIIDCDRELQRSLDLKPGWKFLSRLQDVSDLEWVCWKYLIQTYWCYFVASFTIAEIIRKINKSILKYWYIISSITFILMQMGFRHLLIVLFQPVIFSGIIFCGGKKLLIWIISILILLSYNFLKYEHFFWDFLDHKDLKDEEVYLLLFSIGWIQLRCISFCIDYINSRNKISLEINDKFPPSIFTNLINMFSYVLYLPLLYSGPIILYENFEKSLHVKKNDLLLRLSSFTLDMCIYTTYTFLLEFAFHYIYFLAMQDNMEAIRKLNTFALCGGGLWMGLEFHMKYVISYGITTAFSRLDNMETPPTPRCIARIHVYSQMWRYFDVGLYNFLLKYMHKPSLNAISNSSIIKGLYFSKLTNKLLASLVTFLFIFIWHGTIREIFVWSCLNYVCIIFEHLGKAVSETETYNFFKTRVLKTDAMETRFIAILCTPLLGLSAVSNFYLFAGSEVGDLYLKFYTQPSFWNSVRVNIALYACCQVSMALQDVSSRTDKKSV